MPVVVPAHTFCAMRCRAADRLPVLTTLPTWRRIWHLFHEYADVIVISKIARHGIKTHRVRNQDAVLPEGASRCYKIVRGTHIVAMLTTNVRYV